MQQEVSHSEIDLNIASPWYGYEAGSAFSIELGARASATTGRGSQAVVVLTFDRNYVEYQGYTCGNLLKCTSNYGFAPGKASDPSHHHYISEVVCFDIPQGSRISGNLFTLNLRAKQDIQSPSSWFFFVTGNAPGSCSSNTNSNGYQKTGSIGPKCNYSIDSQSNTCDFGSGLGTGPNPGAPGGTTGGVGNGTGTTGAGTGGGGGGGGGSSANRQGDAPNSIPASADQGEAEQPKLEPSPFFDGKDFEKGSDADTLGSTVSATTDKLKRTWYVPLGLLLMGVGVGGYMWNRRRK